MEIGALNKILLKQILRTSEGFPAQRAGVQARIMTDQGSGQKSVSPRPLGHAVGSHVRGATATSGKTKFGSLDDQVEALWQALNTPEGIQALRAISPGVRNTLRREIRSLFPIEAKLDGGATRTFSTSDQIGVGIQTTVCVAVLEGRERGGRTYLHVQTCYPALSEDQIAHMNARRPGV